MEPHFLIFYWESLTGKVIHKWESFHWQRKLENGGVSFTDRELISVPLKGDCPKVVEILSKPPAFETPKIPWKPGNDVENIIKLSCQTYFSVLVFLGLLYRPENGFHVKFRVTNQTWFG